MLEWRKVTDEKYNKNVDANFFFLAFLVFLHFLFQGRKKKIIQQKCHACMML